MSKETNIQVVARVRACFEPSEDYYDFHRNEIGDTGIRIEVKPGMKFGWLTNPKPHYEYNFSSLFWKDSKQDRIFQDVAMPLISHALDGFNATLFAYGQTGSGKTYTLSGGDNYDDRGIIPRSISYVFQKVRQDTQFRYDISLSYIEIYNNMAYDLLSSEEEQRDRSLDKLTKVQIIDNTSSEGPPSSKNQGSVILMHDNQSHTSPLRKCNDDETAFMLLFLGETNRAIAATQSNDVSSRSHCILTLHIECRDGNGSVKSSKLNFVDLAGSERTENLGDEQNRIREARYINQSLFYLHNVIEKLNTGSDFIPYRDSKITLYLKDSLGGNCMTTMIATLSSKTMHIHETISTCKFAMSVMTIKNNAKVNVSADPQVLIARLRQEICRLKDELAIERGEKNEEPIDLEEADRLKQYVRNFMSGKDEMPSLSKKRVEFCWDYVRTHGFSDKQAQLADSTNGDEKGESLNDEGSKPDGGKQMSDPELRKAAQKLAKKLQRREAEISVLVNMLNQSKSRLNAYVQTNIADNDENDNDYNDNDNDNEQAQQPPVPENPQEKAEAWKKFMLNHPKYSALISNQKTLEAKITSAKTISTKAKQMKSTVEENKEKLKERFAEIEGKDTESDPVMIDLTNKIYSDTNQYTKMVNELTSLKHEVQTIQKIIQQLKKTIKGDFTDFWMSHLKPSQNQRMKQNIPSVHVNASSTVSDASVSISSISSEAAPQQSSLRRPKSRNSSSLSSSASAPDPNHPKEIDDEIVIQSTGDERADELIKQFEQKKKQYLSSKSVKKQQPPQ